MIAILRDNPLLLLFIIAAIGYPLGSIKVGGAKLGVGAVLFVGLAFGAVDPSLKLPTLITTLGIVLSLYTMGLGSGPRFLASLRRNGLRDNTFTVAMLSVAALLSVGVGLALNLQSTLIAGLYAGSLTQAAALAALQESIRATTPPGQAEQRLTEAVVAFSLTYPIGFVGAIPVLALARYLWKPDFGRDVETLRELGGAAKQLINRTIRVTRPPATNVPISTLVRQHCWDVVFGRVKHNGKLSVATGTTALTIGDLVSVLGPPEDIERVIAALGEPSDEELVLDRTELDYRRMAVSNPGVVGHTLRELNLPQQFGAVITRVRRGDVELLPHGDTVLELGDRVRVVTRRDNMKALTAFFGDSYRALSEVDILALGVGIALGLAIGLIPIQLPGGIVVRLGSAGGPLTVGLILGAVQRTGPIVWGLPYNANLTLRQIGLVLFLAGSGTSAGYAFLSTFREGGALPLFAAGIVVTGMTAALTLWVGYTILKIPPSLLFGICAGAVANQSVLEYATEQTQNGLPAIGYTTVAPLSIVVRILLAQLLLTALH